MERKKDRVKRWGSNRHIKWFFSEGRENERLGEEGEIRGGRREGRRRGDGRKGRGKKERIEGRRGRRDGRRKERGEEARNTLRHGWGLRAAVPSATAVGKYNPLS